MNFKKAFNTAAVIAMAVFGATACGGGGGGTSVTVSSHTPRWSHSGRTGYYVVVVGCSAYSSLSCYCDSYGCWYDNSGWYNVGGGYYTGYWPSDTSYTGNSSNSGSYNSGGSYSGGDTSYTGNSSNSGSTYYNGGSTSYTGNSSNSGGSYYNSGSSNTSYSGNSSNSGSYSNSSSSNTSNSGDSSNSGSHYSTVSQTKDVDLQNADVQKQDLTTKAQALASQYSMDFGAAMQLSQLADKFNRLSISGKMTDEDRAAIIDNSLGVAGISTADVNQAIKDGVNGDKQAIDKLLEQGAKNLGMPSSAGLRDQILPQLGIKI